MSSKRSAMKGLSYSPFFDDDFMMNNANVEKEAEKHFLGNLLDDDVFSLKEERLESNATTNPPTIQNIGTVVGGSSSAFWPEPPPPYTPSPHEWGSTLQQPTLTGLSDLFQSGTSTRTGIDMDLQTSSLFGSPVQQMIHHHHHNLHHHTHTHNVVENHHHYHGPQADRQSEYQQILRRATEPEILEPFAPFDFGTSFMPDLSLYQTAPLVENELEINTNGVIGGEKKKKNVVITSNSQSSILSRTTTALSMPSDPQPSPKAIPHSAPVKQMPFSYRDVAARQETQLMNTSASHSDTSPTLPAKKAVKLENEVKLDGNAHPTATKTMSSETPRKGSVDACDRKKKKGDKEFQKIGAKKGVTTVNGRQQGKIPTIENSSSGLALGKFGILTTIKPNDELVDEMGRRKKKQPVVAQEIEPKKSFRAELKNESEDDGSLERTRQPIANPSSDAMTKSEKSNKKKQAQAQQQKKRNKRKPEETYFEVVAVYIWAVLLSIAGITQFCVQWTLQLIVDNCLKIHDVVEFWSESFYRSCIDYVRNSLIWVLSLFIGIFKWIRSFLFFEDDYPPISDDMWGMKRSLGPVSSAQEFIDRMLRLKCVDAFRVLGLASNCEQPELIRNADAIVNSVNHDMDEYDDIIDLVRSAMDAIEDPADRKEYTPANAPHAKIHRDIVSNWRALCFQVHESRNVMHCECGETHKKILTDVDSREARQCDRCGEKHPARENDIWVESRFFGLKMVVLTCTDNAVYDISEWASCQSTMMRNVKTNAHNVQYRLVTTNNQGSSSQMENALENRSASGSTTNSPYDEQIFEMSRLVFNYPDNMRRPKNRKHKRWNGTA